MSLQLRQASKRPYSTINTFTRRPCLNQIISYIIITCDNLAFWLLIQNNYASQESRYGMIAIFTCSLLLLLIFGCLTSAYDPSDPMMTQYRNGNQTVVQKSIPCLYCQYCQSYVQTTSRHCKPCDRCVDKFDHHCIWINNCIGRGNYRIFMGMIITAEVHLFVFVISTVILWAQNRWREFLVSMVLNWIIFGVVLVFSIVLLALIILHFFLISKNLTTYEYVISKRNAQIVPSLAHQNSNQTISQQANPKSKIEIEAQPDKNATDEAIRTSLFLPFNAQSPIKAMDKEDDKASEYRSIEFFKQSRLEMTKTEMNARPKSQSGKNTEQQFQNLNDFYKTHRGLKLLIGNGVTIRSKNSSSCKQIEPQQGKQLSESGVSQAKSKDLVEKINQKFEDLNIVYQD